MSKTGTIDREFKLDHRSCDEIADIISGFCTDAGADTRDVLRYRLSAEECLLYWLNQGLEGSKVTLASGRYLFSNFFSISIEAETGNPYLDKEKSEVFGSFCDSILVSLHLNPEYSIRNRETRIRFKVKKKQRGQIATLLMVIAAAAAFGALGLLMPEGLRLGILSTVIEPIYDTFFKVLGCIAGPMIFLSVAWGVYGIGDTATLGQIGKKMMLKYTGLVFIVTACTTVFFPFLGPGLSAAADQGGGAAAYAMLYVQLGIPDAALALTLALDMLLDFIVTAFSVVIIQYTLIDISAGMGMIDKKVLRSEET